MIGGFDRRIPYSFTDIDLIMSFYERGYTPFIIPNNWGNEIRNENIKSGLCKKSTRMGRQMLKQFWMDGNNILKKRKEPVESFVDKDILTVDQNDFFSKGGK